MGARQADQRRQALRRCPLTAREATEDSLEEQWKALEESRQVVQHRLRTRFGLAISDWRDRVLERIDSRRGLRLEELITTETLLQLGEMVEILRERVEPGLVEAIRQGFEAGRLQIEAEGAIDPDSPVVRKAVRRVFDEGVQEHAETTLEQMEEIVRQARREDVTMQTLRDRLEGYYDEDATDAVGPRARADMGARTASTAQFGEGQLEAWRREGIRGKRWLSQRDSRVRTSHRTLDGTTIRLEDTFEVRGASLRFPGDPNAPPDETINCRCSMLPRENIPDDT